MKRKNVFPYRLQFFADEGGQGQQQTQQQKDTMQQVAMPVQQSVSPAQQLPGKSEEQIRQESQNALLSGLGFKNVEELKKAVDLYTAMINTQLSQEQLQAQQKQREDIKLQDALQRAAAAENKLTCFRAGVQSDSIEDVLAIAMLRVTKEKTLDKVLGEMKKDKKYDAFFAPSPDDTAGSNNDKGTGATPGHTSGDGQMGSSLGKRLGEARKKTMSVQTRKFFGE